MLALHCFGVAAPAEYFTIVYGKLSAFFGAHKVVGFPPASFSFVSPIFQYNLLEAGKCSMVMIVSFTLASGICPQKRFLNNFFWKLTHRNTSTMNKPIFSILLKLTQSKR
ncbi:hypothetical protein MUO71_08865 [Candidatus Bathyarchaeota archaeon]|nr:hypothetical protein [Candidatus Bathyarchaeota archaeon]